MCLPTCVRARPAACWEEPGGDQGHPLRGRAPLPVALPWHPAHLCQLPLASVLPRPTLPASLMARPAPYRREAEHGRQQVQPPHLSHSPHNARAHSL